MCEHNYIFAIIHFIIRGDVKFHRQLPPYSRPAAANLYRKSYMYAAAAVMNFDVCPYQQSIIVLIFHSCATIIYHGNHQIYLGIRFYLDIKVKMHRHPCFPFLTQYQMYGSPGNIHQ